MSAAETSIYLVGEHLLRKMQRVCRVAPIDLDNGCQLTQLSARTLRQSLVRDAESLTRAHLEDDSLARLNFGRQVSTCQIACFDRSQRTDLDHCINAAVSLA